MLQLLLLVPALPPPWSGAEMAPPARVSACLLFAPDASPYTLQPWLLFQMLPLYPFQFFSFCGASCYCLYVNCMFPVNRLVSVACPDRLLNIDFAM